jgi:biotin synthase-related radical SAM superfamily protein
MLLTKMSQLQAAKDYLPRTIRVSTGSAIALGLIEGKINVAPTTAYLMTYRRSKCRANCKFCPQARTSTSKADMLSRVSWPTFPTTLVICKLKEAREHNVIRRICIQALNYPRVFTHLQTLVEHISKANIPISVSCQPSKPEDINRLAKAGVERIGIPVDAAIPDLFDRVKGKLAGGPYTWGGQLELLKKAVSIFGKGRVSTHLIVGLGETEKEIVRAIQNSVDMGVLPGLFAFTPIRGTGMENVTQPPILRYRRIQVARHLVLNRISQFERMLFDEKGQLVDFGVESELLKSIVLRGRPFVTSGCPDCNRPYYNEKPSGPIYNFPKELTGKEALEVWHQLDVGRGSNL